MALTERTEAVAPGSAARSQRRAGVWLTARPRLHLSARGGIIAALLLLTLLKQFWLVAAYPPFQGHDETGHYGNLWTMEHLGRLPTLADNLPLILDPYSNFTLDWPADYTANHPPLYYLLTYPVMRLAGDDGPAGLLPRLYALRLVAALLFTLAVWLTYLFVRTLFPRDQFLTLTVPAAIAFGPQLSFEGAILNNDSLSIFWGTLLLLVLAATLRYGLTNRRAFALGLALGAGLLVKATLTIFLPLAALVAIWSRWPRPWSASRTAAYWRSTLLAAALLAAPLGALAAPWYAYLYRTYGDFSAFKAIQELQANWNFPAGTFSDLLLSKEFHLERIREYVGYYGWKMIPLTAVQEQLVLGTLILCGVGLLVGLARLAWGWRQGQRPTSTAATGVILVVAANLLIYGAMIYFGTMFMLTQARYIFPVAAATALLGLLGVRALLPERWLRPAAALTILALAAFNAWLFFGSVLAYAFF